MNHPLHRTDEDQDSLFGSPPPSPARGRSPSQETLVVGDQVVPPIAVPSAGVATKNVGTIALPGSHMSCAELPADLPALSLSLPHPASSHHSPFIPPPTPAGTSAHTTVARSRSVSSRASSAASTIPLTVASARKRRTSKAKSTTPAPVPPPITLPGPHEPTRPNFLRSQSSLLGLAGLVGSVKPAQLYTHAPQPALVQQHSPIRGSTPAHPIVLDDDRDAPHIEQQPFPQLQTLRINILSSLSREKNIFPVLESLIKLLGGEPHFTSASPPPEPFARPYGHGISCALSHPPVAPPSAASGSTTPTIPPLKRRKLKHVPAGAVDWDVPFPFAVGEGPKGYRDTWARDRAKQLMTQLLELVQNATKRATIKTATNRGNSSEDRARAPNRRSSRSLSVENQIRQTNSTRENTRESYDADPEGIKMTATPSNVMPEDNPCHFLSSLDSPSAIDSPSPASKDGISIDSEGVVEEGGSVACDYSAFEDWLSQLEQFIPLEPNVPTPESDRGTRSPVPLDSSASGLASNIHALSPTQCDALPSSHAIRDEAIDPALLAISQLDESISQSQSPVSPPTLPSSDIPQALDISSTSSMLTHSPRTSLSSLTEPLTPTSDAFADALTSTIVHQDLDRDPPFDQPVEKDLHSQVPSTEPIVPPCTTRAQKGKVRADSVNVVSATPPAPSRSTHSEVSATSKGVLDKRAILERRKQLVTEIERAKMELWETSIENALLVHLTRDGSS